MTQKRGCRKTQNAERSAAGVKRRRSSTKSHLRSAGLRDRTDGVDLLRAGHSPTNRKESFATILVVSDGDVPVVERNITASSANQNLPGCSIHQACKLTPVCDGEVEAPIPAVTGNGREPTRNRSVTSIHSAFGRWSAGTQCLFALLPDC